MNIDGTYVFNNLEIDRGSTFIANGYAVIIPQGSKVTIQLEGTSTLTAAPGYAAILVEEGAELTISGDGTLNANGGNGLGDGNGTDLPSELIPVEGGADYPVTKVYVGGSAAIDGNGCWFRGKLNNSDMGRKVFGGTTPNFGTIIIESGTINATGGNAKTCETNLGAGAGIGSGANTDLTAKDLSIKIHGNPVIHAVGGYEGDTSAFGGAGIGCGDNGYLWNGATIEIGGSAIVTAEGHGAAAVRTLLLSGALQNKVNLTVVAAYQGELTDGEQAIKEQMTSGEQAQVWNLTVQLSVVARDGSDITIGSKTVNLSKIDHLISFHLTTGENYTGRSVRVLYLHNGEVKTAGSSVVDAATGLVSVLTQEFSPYAILSKTRSSSGGNVVLYPIIITDKTPSDGRVSADRTSAIQGAKVNITVTPEQSYELDKLTVTDKGGKVIPVTAKGNGKYTFTMPASKVLITATFTDNDWHRTYVDCLKDETCPIWPFTDAKTTDWYHDGVHLPGKQVDGGLWQQSV